MVEYSTDIRDLQVLEENISKKIINDLKDIRKQNPGIDTDSIDEIAAEQDVIICNYSFVCELCKDAGIVALIVFILTNKIAGKNISSIPVVAEYNSDILVSFVLAIIAFIIYFFIKYFNLLE